jgi:hypothetical protein
MRLGIFATQRHKVCNISQVAFLPVESANGRGPLV